MTLTTDEVQVGIDVIDLLLKSNDDQNSYHSNNLWTINIHNSPSPGESSADDFLESLLGGSDCSSAPASPLWSPCTSYSAITEHHAGYPTESPASFRLECDTQWTAEPPKMEIHPTQDKVKMEKTSHVAVDLGCDCADLEEKFGLTYYLKASHPSLRPSSQPLTVKDLLQSNLGQKRVSQHSLQELVLDEDEKRLLVKEGVKLPCKLPLSKFEERVLKKIRRKIRNKRSAQESRKKKREYVDGLEGRMSACNAHNLELQKRIHQLEENNRALLDQLSKLQAALVNNPRKGTPRGTCILVLLLSFSLLISSNLQPDPPSRPSQGDFTDTQVPSRSLLSTEMRDTPPLLRLSLLGGVEVVRSGIGRIWSWAQMPTADHRHRDYV